MLPRRLSRRSIGVVAIALTGATGCHVPNFRGPQIQSPPTGFLLQNETYQQRRMFPSRDLTMHSAWIRATGGPYSGIYINGHAGVIGIEEVAAAQEEARAAAADPRTRFGEIEAMTIDGRTAWGWAEKLETPDRGIDWVAYRTVVAYDTVSYAIEFYTADPSLTPVAPDSLEAVIASFEIGETEYDLPMIAIAIGVLLLGLRAMRTRAVARAARLKSIHLVQVPKKGCAGEGEPGGTAPAGAGADATAPGAPATPGRSTTPQP